MLVINFFGLKRSGNHAVINWIIANSGIEGAVHMNNVFDLSESPPKIINQSQIKKELSGNTKLLVLSYEDVSLNDGIIEVPAYKFSENHKFVNVILLRDFYNFLASRIGILESIKKAGVRNPIQKVSLEEVKNLWKQYAKEYQGKTNFIKESLSVSYNDWYKSKDYRDELLRDLFGVNSINKDKDLNKVSDHGRGSSFDGLTYDGRANEMKVLERWKVYQEKPIFQNLINDDLIRKINREVFKISVE